MNQTQSSDPATYNPLRPRHHLWGSLSWAAVFGGLTAALALQVLFVMFGAGLGFAIYNPITSENPIEGLSRGAIIVQGVSAMFSLWVGGWIAGRFSPLISRASGGLHGLLVWCAATVAGVLVISLGAGWMVGDLSKVVGGGLSAAGKPAAAAVSGVSDLAKNAAKQTADTLKSFTDEAVAQRPGDAPRAGSVRAQREISLAVGRLFNPMQKEKMADNKAALTRALVESGISPQDADRLVAGWIDTYNELTADLTAAKDQAEAQAREAAEKAARTLSIFSLAAFFAFLIGALSAAYGGYQGAQSAYKHDDRGEIPI
jgi:hypothetical protein